MSLGSQELGKACMGMRLHVSLHCSVFVYCLYTMVHVHPLWGREGGFKWFIVMGTVMEDTLWPGWSSPLLAKMVKRC